MKKMTGQEGTFTTNEPLANTPLIGEVLGTFSDSQLNRFVQDINTLGASIASSPPERHSRRVLIASTFAPLILSLKGFEQDEVPFTYSRREFLKHLEMTLIALALFKAERIIDSPEVVIDHTQSTLITPIGDSLAAGVGSVPIYQGETRAAYISRVTQMIREGQPFGFVVPYKIDIEKRIIHTFGSKGNISIATNANLVMPGASSWVFLKSMPTLPEDIILGPNSLILFSMGANDIFNASGLLDATSMEPDKVAQNLLTMAVAFGINLDKIFRRIREADAMLAITGRGGNVQLLIPEMYPLYNLPAFLSKFESRPLIIEAMKAYIDFFNLILKSVARYNCFVPVPMDFQGNLSPLLSKIDNLHPDPLGYDAMARNFSAKTTLK